MTGLTPEQMKAIQIAHDLADMGAPIFAMFRDSSTGGFLHRDQWQLTRPGQVSHNWIDRWRPGMALAMVTGVVHDVLDIDPRNGGDEGYRELLATGAVPVAHGEARTPSAGCHLFIARTHLAKTSKAAKGVDLQAGQDDGGGRGFVFIAPTVRTSRFGPDEGTDVAYRWVTEPQAPASVDEVALANLRDVITINRGRPLSPAGDKRVDKLVAADDDPWDLVDGDWTKDSADRVIATQLEAVARAREGEVNSALGGAARVLGRFVAGGYLSEGHASAALLDALERGGVHSDSWNAANGKKWTAGTVIGAGLANGGKEPWSVDVAPALSSGGSTDRDADDEQDGTGTTDAPATPLQPATTTTASVPRLLIQSAAEMAYWLQNALGSATLSGFFLRDGQVVHTPRVDELGYVEPRAGEDDNGPAQIQAVTAGTLTAKIQYAHACYKEVDVKGPDGKKTGEKAEVDALFPLEAARRAVDAPEAMGMLRPLAGITHTPMVRADGSVLEAYGYDPASRYLFLPAPGVKVARVPADPTPADLRKAMGLLDEMLAGFPWESKDDLANYLGLLLTPMLRLVTPPSYKMFGIGAHQPGSGKTLLADVVTALHGGVLRSESPGADEPEWRKQITTILATTSAPVVHIDNVTGVLKSSTLAGTLTAGQAVSDRVLGKSEMVTTVNDRVWVVTGNNLSLGGDLVRRTIIITIDPNMANPETREFAIADLKGWVAAHRNELLWALLVMIRTWVAAGRPLAARAQSDSFAAWEASVAGILSVCGVAGSFDDSSGQKAAAGGDDDGLAQVLEHIWARHAGQSWRVAEVLTEADADTMVMESRDWLPAVALDKLARSEAAGRKSFGHWLRFRLGRWIAGSDGHSYVLREAGSERGVALWRVERTA